MTLDWDKVDRDRYDGWRTATPHDFDYDYDEFCDFVDANPSAGFDAESVHDYHRWAQMMKDEDDVARGEDAADRAEADRDDDDRAFWNGMDDNLQAMAIERETE